VHHEPLRRVHECVFGVLALERASRWIRACSHAKDTGSARIVVVTRGFMPEAENRRDIPEKRWAGRLLWIAVASALFWLVHGFAIRSLFQAVRHTASKLGH